MPSSPPFFALVLKTRHASPPQPFLAEWGRCVRPNALPRARQTFCSGGSLLQLHSGCECHVAKSA
eukprot:1153391-Pelagomonas_calceolata.AAC.18